jgi:hypothetical protein
VGAPLEAEQQPLVPWSYMLSFAEASLVVEEEAGPPTLPVRSQPIRHK